MSDIDAMQGRIMAALERIGKGLDAATTGAADDGELDALRQQLEDERLANGQLEERVKTLGERAKTAEKAAEAAQAGGEEHAGALRKLDRELQALRRANQQLRDNNSALRSAGEAGVVEPHLINKAMMAELEGLRAARSADRAEMDVILSELDQIAADKGTGSEAATPEEGA